MHTAPSSARQMRPAEISIEIPPVSHRAMIQDADRKQTTQATTNTIFRLNNTFVNPRVTRTRLDRMRDQNIVLASSSLIGKILNKVMVDYRLTLEKRKGSQRQG